MVPTRPGRLWSFVRVTAGGATVARTVPRLSDGEVTARIDARHWHRPRLPPLARRDVT